MSDREFNFRFAVTVLVPVAALSLWIASWGHWLAALLVFAVAVVWLVRDMRLPK